jgi:hypothetical protein
MERTEALIAKLARNDALVGAGGTWPGLLEMQRVGAFSLPQPRVVYVAAGSAKHPERISPDAYALDQALLDRPGNDHIQPVFFGVPAARLGSRARDYGGGSPTAHSYRCS